MDRPVATALYGIIVVYDVTGELVEPGEVADLYPEFSDERVWGTWRIPSLEDLVHTWPSKAAPTEHQLQRGWWLPTIEELREARRTARSRERRLAAQPPA